MLTTLLGIFSSLGILYILKSTILRYFLWVILRIKYYTRGRKKKLNLKMISDNNCVFSPQDIVGELENPENLNGIILEGRERSIVFDKIEMISFINGLIHGESLILSVSLVTEKGEVDISNVLSQYIHPGHQLTKDKIMLLLHLSNISFQENDNIEIIDTNADSYTISLHSLDYIHCDINTIPTIWVAYKDD